jgi:hypothetical protein
MIERQHGVGLAAAEIGLQLDHRIAALSCQAQHAVDEQAFEALGKKGAVKKLAGVFILIGTFAQMHLPKIGGKLGLLVAAAGHIGMGDDHLAPWLERSTCRWLDQGSPGLAFLAAHLLLVYKAAKFHLHLADLVCLGC